MPHALESYLAAALLVLRSDERILGVAAGGSFISGEMDEYSDLDLLLVVEPETWPHILESRSKLAKQLGPLLASFTGEHVGEPRLLICLYGPPLVHVDLKFVSLEDLDERVEDPVILWDRTGQVTEKLSRESGHYPEPDLQWIEDRFWVWVHYGAAKVARGELFEVLGFLAFLRGSVIGPMSLTVAGQQPNGVRKLETRVPELRAELLATIGSYDSRRCAEALLACANIYQKLRAELAPSGFARRSAVEDEALSYLGRLLD
jgi:predicted nucleotidyltransferase